MVAAIWETAVSNDFPVSIEDEIAFSRSPKPFDATVPIASAINLPFATARVARLSKSSSIPDESSDIPATSSSIFTVSPPILPS